jgi:hypothetical protein
MDDMTSLLGGGRVSLAVLALQSGPMSISYRYVSLPKDPGKAHAPPQAYSGPVPQAIQVLRGHLSLRYSRAGLVCRQSF